MVNIYIKIDNKLYYSIVTLLFILIVMGVVYSYNSLGNPSIMGHSLNEIELPSCLTNQTLIKTASGWICANSHKDSVLKVVPINILDDYHSGVNCGANRNVFFIFASACNRYCSNTCYRLRTTLPAGCAANPVDNGLDFVSGYPIEQDCTGLNVICVCSY